MDDMQKHKQPADRQARRGTAADLGGKKYDPVPYPDETTKKACEAINRWADHLQKWAKAVTDEVNEHAPPKGGSPPTHVPDPPPPPFK